MRVGPLRHRVRIERKVEDGGGPYGEPVTTWEPVITVWAQISPQSARETDAAGQTLGQTTYEITMRYRELDYTHRLVHQGAIYDIREVRPPNVRNMLTLVCTTGTTDG